MSATMSQYSDIIQRLPGDALILILHHVGPSQLVVSHPANITKIYVPPMTFSLVCRSWRALVAEQPSLWSRFDVDIHIIRPVDRKLLRLVQSWLRNSSPSLLEFRCKIVVEVSSRDDVLEELMSQLLSHSHRWRHVGLKLHYTFLEDFLPGISLPSSPSLTFLGIRCATGYTESPNKRIAVSLDLYRSPHLRTLVVESGVKLRLIGRQPLHIGSLSQLNISVDASVLGDFQRVLSASTNLIVLEVATVGYGADPTDTHSLEPSILLPNLTALHLEDTNRNLLVELLEWIICPKLELLRASNAARNSILERNSLGKIRLAITTDLLQAFDNFIQRSRPPLHNFHLDYFARSGHIPATALNEECCPLLRSILARLNGLLYVFLCGLVVDDQLIRDMTFEEGNNRVICPLLKVMSLFCEGHDVLPQEVANMIVSRWKSEQGLISFHYDISGVEDISGYKEVEECIREGLELLNGE